MFGIEGEPVPAALDISGIGLAKPRRGAHDTVFEHAAGAIGRLVERRQHVTGELRRLAEDRLDEVGSGRLVAGQPRQFLELGHLLEHKAHIGDWSGIGHVGSPGCVSLLSVRIREKHSNRVPLSITKSCYLLYLR